MPSLIIQGGQMMWLLGIGTAPPKSKSLHQVLHPRAALSAADIPSVSPLGDFYSQLLMENPTIPST